MKSVRTKQAIRGISDFDGPPWVIERLAGIVELGDDRTAEKQAELSQGVLRALAGDDLSKLVFFVSDNANDEIRCGHLLASQLSNLHFIVQDTTHSLQIPMRHATDAEPEVCDLERALLTDKRPTPSVANLLRNDSRFRASFSKEQQKECLKVLRHLGYAPQRMDSRKKPYAGFCRRLRSVFAASAVEAESKDRAKAKHVVTLIEKLASYKKLVLAGLMADLAHEHSNVPKRQAGC